MLNTKILKRLKNVEKPSRYLGGEFNTPLIKIGENIIRNCFCFPDNYEVGSSHTGLKILYEIFNNQEFASCERCFAPWFDFGNVLKEENEELFSLETKTPLKEFDFLHFTFQYELSYTNLLYMLDLAHIPFYSIDRNSDYPIVIGGGPCSLNLEPIADFLDAVVIGDGEEVNIEIMKVYQKKLNKKEFLNEISKIEGVYVPSLHHTHEENGLTIVEGKVNRTFVKNLDTAYFSIKPLVPNIEIVHDRASIEIFRGCSRGCRFCQAGFYYRPIRERSVEKILELSNKIINSTGYSELSLLSLSSGDYSQIEPLIHKLKENFKDENVKLALPSLRLDSFEGAFTLESKKSSLTFAPEAGSQRLRDVINKNITENDILDSLEKAFACGYDKIKLYFMIGLPTEQQEDLEAIVDLAKKIQEKFKQCGRGKKPFITISTSIFIPKPFTPFQWETHIENNEALKKANFLKTELSKIKVNYKYHEVNSSYLETVLARGDRKLGKLILEAYKLGCYFDGWSEFFQFDKWRKASDIAGIEMEKYTKSYDINLSLPWDYIDIGVSNEYFINERNKAMLGQTTKDCRLGCNLCGLQKTCSNIKQ